MRTQQILYHVLFLWLLLAAFQHHSTVTSKVQAVKSGDFETRPAKYSLRSTTGHVLTSMVNEKKIYKKPSGPNPVGNHRPPTRP